MSCDGNWVGGGVGEEKMQYVLVQFGETTYIGSRDDVEREARFAFNEEYNSHHRKQNKTPPTIDGTFYREMDIRMFRLDCKSEVNLPMQIWVEEYYDELADAEAANEEYDYNKFVELYPRFFERYMSENGVPPNWRVDLPPLTSQPASKSDVPFGFPYESGAD